MELLERYMIEVARQLGDGRQDVIDEISDEVQSQMEARAAELGRPLNDDDVAGILAAYGNPYAVALRHRPPRYLIGPLLFPFYEYVLKIVILTVIILDLIGATVAALISSEPLEMFLSVVAILWPAILYPVGVITILFAVAERCGAGEMLVSRINARPWDPRRLPATSDEPLSRGQILFEAFTMVAGVAWLLSIPAVRASVGIDAGSSAPLAPIWHVFFLLLFAGAALTFVSDIIVAIQPERVRLRRVSQIVANAIYLAAAALTIPASPFLRPTTGGPADAASLTIVNDIILSTLAIFALICIILIAINVRALLKPASTPRLNITGA